MLWYNELDRKKNLGDTMTEARKQWEKEKKVKFSLNLQKSTDKDIIEYLEAKKSEGITVNGLVKDSLRLLMKQEESLNSHA